MAENPSTEISTLDKPRHLRYWTRCLKTYLPHHYTGNESNRMYLGFLTLCALDILDVLTTTTTAVERAGYIDWIYHCQHPRGGFRMWPGTDFGEQTTDKNRHWDPANVPATYFALTSLLILGDDLARVRRQESLRWLAAMQRREGEERGSFGETCVKGKIEGGSDPRFAFCAMGVRFILRGNEPEGEAVDTGEGSVPDVDVDALVKCILRAESYGGGIADEPFREPHAGYTYCALGALAFTNRLRIPAMTRPRQPTQASSSETPSSTPTAPQDPDRTLRWLVDLQTAMLDPEDELPIPCNSPPHSETPSHQPPLHQSPTTTTLPFLSAPILPESPTTTGLSGRPNKPADTCYCWWVLGALHLLQQPTLLHAPSIRAYLLGHTQHPFLGGFGKAPGGHPDVYHSCLGLVVLGLLGDDADGQAMGLKTIDPAMCVSRDVRARLDGVWARW